MIASDPNIIYKTKSVVQHDCPTPHQTLKVGYFSAFKVDYGPGTLWLCPECNTTWKLGMFGYPQDNMVAWRITKQKRSFRRRLTRERK